MLNLEQLNLAKYFSHCLYFDGIVNIKDYCKTLLGMYFETKLSQNP